MKLNAGTFASMSARTWSSNFIGEYGLKDGRVPPSDRMCGASVVRLRWNAASSDVFAPSSSIDTQRFIANGLSVIVRSSAITSLIALGAQSVRAERTQASVI